MAEFALGQSFWCFERGVKYETRYLFDAALREFIDIVLATSKSRTKRLKAGTILSRAQLGYRMVPEQVDEENSIDVEAAFGPDRMVPDASRVGDGRVNPRGIPCLYLATNATTAMAEVRPWAGSYVSLAQFRTTRDCRIVDCSADTKNIEIMFATDDDEATPAMREAWVWAEIASAYSTPVSPHEPHIDYVATQVLSEAFRSHSIDGVLYKSFLGDGKNIALFDLTAAELLNCGLQRTDKVKYEFSQADNPYYIARHYPEIQESLDLQAKQIAEGTTDDDETEPG